MAPTIPGFLLLVIPAILGLLGLWLVVAGWRGRRVGQEPRCARCNYVLLHLESAQCPECGTAIMEANTVVGERRRRWGRLAVGMVLLLLAILAMVPQVTSAVAAIPWYQYKPAGFVLDDLNVPGMHQKAITELERREAAGTLPERIRRKLVEIALNEQAPTTASPRQELLDYLGTELLNGRLSDAQKQQFVDQACTPSMTVRPVVAEGDKVPFYVWLHTRGPQANPYPTRFWMEYDERQQRQDGTATHTGSSGTRSISGASGSGSSLPAGNIGKHTLQTDVTWTLWFGPHGEAAVSQRIGKQSRTVSATYEVVSKDQAPRIELLDSPELRVQVLKAVKLDRLSRLKSGEMNARFAITSAPCDLAFEVAMITDGGEIPLGSFSCAKGKTTNYHTGGSMGSAVGKTLPAKATVRIRSSVDVAKGTVDATAIYSGAITFSDVEITQENY